MKRFLSRLSELPETSEIFLPALTVLFGLQLLRVMIPQMAWLLGDRFGLGAPVLGLVALAIFSFSFLAGTMRRITGERRLIIITAGSLGLSRLLVQVQWSEPLITFAFAIAGTVLFGLFLALYTDEIRSRGIHSTGNLVSGFLAAFILDTALHGLFGTYDMAWRSGFPALLITIILVLLYWLAAAAYKKNEISLNGPGGNTWPWLAVGPFIFLQMVVFQNVARHTVTTGWIPPLVFGLVIISQIAGLFAAVFVLRNNLTRLPVVITAGTVLTVCTVFPFPGQPWLAALILLVEQVSISLLLAVILTGTTGTEGSQRSVTAPNGTGFLLIGILTLAYYTVYQISLPYTNTVLEVAAAVLVAICALVSCFRAGYRENTIQISRATPLLVLVLLVPPLVQAVTYSEPAEHTGDGYPVKIMTYNLHNGFNTGGDLDMEALALVIEENDPDIIALQEISRGWLVSGRMDMLEWLSQRLDMPYVSGPTEGELWGSAVLSRFPVVESENYELPPRTLFLRRGFLVTKIDIGDGEILTFIATHLHHMPEDSEIRLQQVPVILDYCENAETTVITGDFNAEPDAPEIQMLRDTGLLDAMADSIPPAGYTFNSADLYQRIDYIWITPDLKAENPESVRSTASDHLPVIIEIDK